MDEIDSWSATNEINSTINFGSCLCLRIVGLWLPVIYEKNAVSPPMQRPNSNVTVSYIDYAENTKSQDYENGDLIYLRDYDAWQQEVYGPLIALGPFLVDKPE